MHTMKILTVFLLTITLFTSCTNPNSINPDPISPEPPVITETPTEIPTPLFPIPSLKVIQTLSGHGNTIPNTFSISSTGVIAIQKGNYVHFIDAYTGDLLHTEVEKDDILYGVGAIIFSPDGDLMVNNHENSASVWNVNEQKVLYTLNENITSFSEDGQYLNGNNSIFHSSDGQIFFNRENFLTQYVSNYDKFYGNVTGPVFSPDRSVFAIITWIKEESVIEIRQTSDYKLLQTIPDVSIKSWESPQLSFNTANTTLLTNHVTSPLSDDPTSITKLWQIDTLKILNSFTNELPSEILVNSQNNILVVLNNLKIDFFNLDTGVLLYTLPTNSFVLNMLFSPDGNSLILNHDTHLEIRNANDGKLRYVINADEGTYIHNSIINFSPDSSKFTLNQFNGNVVYQLSDGKMLKKFSTQTNSYNGLVETTYDNFKFMPDSNSILALRLKRQVREQQYDDTFIVFNIRDGNELADFTSGPNDHAEFTLSTDGTLLSSFNDYPAYFPDTYPSIPAHVWDISNGTLLQRIMNLNPTSISDVLISPNNQILVTTRTTASYHKILDFWNVTSGKWLFEVPRTSTNYRFSTDSKIFYIGTNQYDVETTSKTIYPIPEHPFTYSAHNSDNSILITSGRVSNGTIPYTSGDFTRDLNIWKINDGQNLQSFKNSEGRVSPNGELLAMFNYSSNSLELRQANSGKKIYTLLDNIDNSSFYNYENFYQISGFSSDSSSFFYQTDLETIQLWDTKTGQLKRTIQLNGTAIDRVHVNSDGSFMTLATSTEIGTYDYKKELSLWRIKDGVRIKTFDNLLTTDSHSYSVEFSPDGKKLIIGLGHVDYGNTITVYGNENNEPIFTSQDTN